MKKVFVLLIILLTVLLAVSCSSTSGDKSENNANQTDAANTNAEDSIATAEPTTVKILPDVPDKNFEGYEFTILANSTDYNLHWYSRDIYVEGENGDAINDAVYYRNRTIEDKYNITIKGIFSANQYNDARKSINAGDNKYDVLTIPLQGGLSNLGQEGMLLDLKNVPYINLEKPWWDQKANRQLSIGHKLMSTISDLLIIDKDALAIFLFNKDVLKEYGLEDPYQLVRDGKWTIDKMWDMAKTVTQDINGDGIMDDSDKYGLISQLHSLFGQVICSGQFTVAKDANDMPVLNITNPVIKSSFDKWMNILNDKVNMIAAQDWEKKYPNETIWDQQLEMLTEKRGLFLYTHMNRVTLLREAECNFGILPNPKYDESQNEYYNFVSMWCSTGVSIPVTSDPERTGIVLEALTAESYYTLRPAYYDISLKSKLMRDNESGEMLDLIFENRSYDLMDVYNWGGILNMFTELGLNRRTDFVSAYEKILPKVEAAIQKTIDNFNEHE